jgi:hypothetical protein
MMYQHIIWRNNHAYHERSATLWTELRILMQY